MDRFLLARTVPHLDGGLGIYGCSDEAARQWISEIREMVRNGIGAP